MSDDRIAAASAARLSAKAAYMAAATAPGATKESGDAALDDYVRATQYEIDLRRLDEARQLAANGTAADVLAGLDALAEARRSGVLDPTRMGVRGPSIGEQAGTFFGESLSLAVTEESVSG